MSFFRNFVRRRERLETPALPVPVPVRTARGCMEESVPVFGLCADAAIGSVGVGGVGVLDGARSAARADRYSQGVPGKFVYRTVW